VLSVEHSEANAQRSIFNVQCSGLKTEKTGLENHMWAFYFLAPPTYSRRT